MKSIITKIKAKLSAKSKKKKIKPEYTDLAPIDKIENGAEYLNALKWALGNKRVKNIALAGPYGSGKSSIIATYLKLHPLTRRKSLRVSMATFVENIVDNDGNLKKIDIGKSEIELGILKQLFYKVEYKKIPQSRYRKLHKIRWGNIWAYLVALSTIICLITYIFLPDVFNTTINKIVLAGANIGISNNASKILFGALVIVLLAVLAVMYRSILSHFKIKEIKLPIDATVKSGEEPNETIFNKYMDEIVYFFEETKYQVVFFEDLDRLDDSSVFVHLRDLNTLLNNYNAIKNPIIFVYAVKDDIFSDTDRTKFFEFIIPVIPIINSTNSGEILLEKLDSSREMGIEHEISKSFVLDVSPFISDMRVLQNIYNEFVVYKKTLRIEQGLKLLDEPMMALIIFKNLYPCDFADIQMEQGVIKQAFSDKQKYLSLKKDAIQSEIDESEKVLNSIQSEALINIKELKVSFLSEITNWRGVANQITPNKGNTVYGPDIIENDFDISQWDNSTQCTGLFNNWMGSGNYSFSCNKFSEKYASYAERENRIKLIEQNRIADKQKEVENLKQELRDISGYTLKQCIDKFGYKELLSDVVKKNKVLVFLLRRGYIDEKYVNYINYFKGNTVTREDMNYILSVKNMEPQPFNYNLVKTDMVVQNLQVYEFGQKAIYNFNLLEYMLSAGNYNEKLNTFMRQLANEDDWSWRFIDEFMDLTLYQSTFIELLSSAWLNIWDYIAENAVLTYERKIYYLVRIISNVPIDTIVSMNANNQISDFMEENEDILLQLAIVENNIVIDVIEATHVIFRKVAIENVSKDVLDYIFDNNCYELNPLMIQYIAEYKNKSLIPDLKTKNYTTLIKLNYAPLIEYVRENLEQYIEKIVLAEKCILDDEEQILDLLERIINNHLLCIEIIKREDFCLNDITFCCNNLITDKKADVKNLWDALLKNNKIFPSWENVGRYWSIFKFTQNLLEFMENHIDDLVSADSKSISDNFIRGFISSEIADEAFEALLPCIRMNNFDIELDKIDEDKVLTMIECRYFDFSIERYSEIENSHEDLCEEFILHNQADYIDLIDEIQMNASLLEKLLLSNKIEAKTTQILLDTYSTKYMTNRIADNIHSMEFTMNLKIFKAVWEYLDGAVRQRLMMEHLELLDADDLYSCFEELRGRYSNFLDRSKQHVVELENTSDNQKLVERLKEKEYITSYQLKEKKEYDTATETERVRTIMSCRIKAVK